MVEALSEIETFLGKLRATKDNHQFLALITTDFALLMRLNTLLKSSSDIQLPALADAIR